MFIMLSNDMHQFRPVESTKEVTVAASLALGFEVGWRSDTIEKKVRRSVDMVR
jgi:hypothetical protein